MGCQKNAFTTASRCRTRAEAQWINIYHIKMGCKVRAQQNRTVRAQYMAPAAAHLSDCNL
eukprot:COSAG06_NODE_4327_length_4364_cov_2.274091_4_plen_60_part_00